MHIELHIHVHIKATKARRQSSRVNKSRYWSEAEIGFYALTIQDTDVLKCNCNNKV